MISNNAIISLDFGIDYIRVAKTRYDQDIPGVLNPQLIEFNGRRSLRNIVLLNPELNGIQEIGEEVINSDMLYDTPQLVRRGLSLVSDPKSELGQVTKHMLERIYQVLELDLLPDDERSKWETILAVPSSMAHDIISKCEERIRDASFPSPCSFDTTLAIVAYYYPSDPTPGLYLVVDCGAGDTRIALCEIAGQDVQIWDVKAGRPGGRDFDQLLIEHFNQVITDSTLLSSGSRLEMAFFIEEFKKQFSHSWAIGHDSYEALYPIPSAQTILNLRCADFESSLFAGELIASFQNLARQVVDENNINPGQLKGVYLAGGGTHWPFVRTWANKLVGTEKVHVDGYPEEVIVCGLTHLAIESSAMHRSSEYSRSTSNQFGIKPNEQSFISADQLQQEQRTISPSRAFWFEFVGGLLGMMGVGWFFVLHNVPLGCMGLIGWWIIIAITVIGLGIFSTGLDSPLPMVAFILIWLGVPLLSAIMANWEANRSLRKGGA